MSHPLLTSLYRATFGVEPARTEPLPTSGSSRQYFRLYDDRGQSVVGTVGTDVEENDAFCYLTRHFTARHLPVPTLLAVSDDHTAYLQSDIGQRSLFDAIAKGRSLGGEYDDREQALLAETMRQLPRLQFQGADGIDWKQCYPQESFDEDTIRFDLNYFKYSFLKPTDTPFHEVRLERDFEQLTRRLLSHSGSSGFMMRDCQARNIMLDDADRPHFIDYQGGRRGPCLYDLASFLWQAAARYSPQLRENLLHVYHEAACRYAQLPPFDAFRQQLSLFVFFRTLQVLGAYGYRGYFQRKPHFLASIPQALHQLLELLPLYENDYPYLCRVLRDMTQRQQTEPLVQLPQPRPGRLTVTIWSFSYKHGIPADTSGNGGGYVFDCRSTHNPGRYQPYRHLTGLDQPVIAFLEENGEITDFLSHVYSLADFHVRRYLERGFTSLTFAFGCTGGQHRSVYSAQHLAEYLRDRFPVDIRLIHREQHIAEHWLAKTTAEP